jgi:hypothetical protein
LEKRAEWEKTMWYWKALWRRGSEKVVYWMALSRRVQHGEGCLQQRAESEMK